MKRLFGALGLLLILASTAGASNPLQGELLNRATQAIAFTKTQDISDLKGISAQAIYNDSTPAALTFSDGARTSDYLSILSTTSLAGKTLQVGTMTFTFGGTGISTGPATGNSTVIIATTVAAALQAKGSTDFRISTGVVGGFSVVTATRDAIGQGEFLTNATSTNTVWSGNVVGQAGAIDPATDLFTKAAHGFPMGLSVLLSTTSGTVPAGLTWGTTYYVSKVNDNAFGLATSTTLAVAGTKVDITSLTGSGVVRLAPLAFTGTASFKWQASVDGVNFTDLSVSSASYLAASASAVPVSTAWDFGTLNYRYLRLTFVPPTTGCLFLDVFLNGRRD